ncbi:MFS transporter [Streptomyces gobiensis]|uniref:MFS transporter n=1 Tax=Streptomyces gobiensis TaxID=2875706 RepID=UPI001E3F14A4|nr:MFS transporter [Streptomyces gobiensis]UGY91984.1 MFS transporter [Streptomyces gobiensis]
MTTANPADPADPADPAALDDDAEGPGHRGFRGIPRPILTVSISVFLNRVGGFFAIFLTLILADRGYDANQITVGLIVVAVSGMGGAGMSGWVADRIGPRRTLLLTTLLTSAFSVALVGIRSYLGTLVFAGLMAAVVQGFSPVAQAVVGEAAHPARRVTMFAVYRTALNIGVALGALLGGLWASSNMETLLWGNAAVGAASAALLLTLPKDPPRQRVQRRGAPGTSEPSKRVERRVLLADPQFLMTCVLLGSVSLVYAQHTGPLPLAMKENGFSTTAFGLLLTMNAVLVILCEIPLSMVVRKFTPQIPIVLGAVCVFGGFVVNATAVVWPVLIGGVLLWTLGEMLISPVAAAAATEAAPQGAGARYQSFLGFCQTTGMSLGPATGVFLYGLGPQVPWLASGALGCVVTVLLFRLLSRTSSRGGAEKVSA